MDKITNELVQEFVEISFRNDSNVLTDWLIRNKFSDGKLKALLSLAELHIQYVDQDQAQKTMELVMQCIAILPLLPHAKKGYEKAKSDKKRSKTLKEKYKQCPANYFKNPKIRSLITFLKDDPNIVANIGLWLTGSLITGASTLTIKEFTAKSLSEAFEKATKIKIQERNWQNWKKELKPVQQNAIRFKLAKRFRDFSGS